jgi:hypothetical protein
LVHLLAAADGREWVLREGGNLLVVFPIEASISLVLVRSWFSRPERAVAGAARAARRSSWGSLNSRNRP